MNSNTSNKVNKDKSNRNNKGNKESNKKLTGQQQRILKLLFKFRFVSAGLLARGMGIRREGVYQVLEQLVDKGFVTKVYEKEYRIERKPAYYYLSTSGVTAVRNVMDVEESVVHALYRNSKMTDDFIRHCMTVVRCYASIKPLLPDSSDIFSKTEINRFTQFPRNRPDLYIRTPDGKEAIVVIVDDKPLYIVRKRLDEIIMHSEDEGWGSDGYPCICFVLKDQAAMHSFLYTTKKKRESMGLEEDELPMLAAALGSFDTPIAAPWSSPENPREYIKLFA